MIITSNAKTPVNGIYDILVSHAVYLLAVVRDLVKPTLPVILSSHEVRSAYLLSNALQSQIIPWFGMYSAGIQRVEVVSDLLVVTPLVSGELDHIQIRVEVKPGN